MKPIEKLSLKYKLDPPDNRKVVGWTDNLMWDKINEVVDRLNEVVGRMENPHKHFKNDVR